MLAADPVKQRAKMAKAVGFCLPRDFTIVEEAHCLEGRCEMLKLPQGLTALWSHDSAAKGGVGIILNQEFLKKFDTINNAEWLEILPGYVAVLRLRGPLGSLDIFCCYFPAGGSESSSIRKILSSTFLAHHHGWGLQLCGNK